MDFIAALLFQTFYISQLTKFDLPRIFAVLNNNHLSQLLNMKILVCVSQVPDTASKISVGPDGKSISTAGIKFILNPYDEYAIEEGLRLREQFTGSVTTLTVGADSGREVLRTALAMGSDTAVLIKDEDRSDSFSVANNIAEYANEMQPDIVVFGRQSIDFDSFQIPPMVAELLQMPNISMVSKLEVSDSAVSAERDVEGGKEVVTCSLPCVISAQKGLNDPRYPKLPDIMKAKSKPIEERVAMSVPARVQTDAMEQPESKRLNKILGGDDVDIAELVRLLHEDAKVI